MINMLRSAERGEGWVPGPSPPPLALAKAFSPSGCGRIFPLFSRVMRERLSTDAGIMTPEIRLLRPLLSEAHD